MYNVQTTRLFAVNAFGLLTIALLFMAVSTADANKWRVISGLPTQRKRLSTAVLDGKIYLRRRNLTCQIREWR